MPSPLLISTFCFGFFSALTLGCLLKILIGMRLNLYLIARDSGVVDQNIIPLTSEMKKRSWWKTLRKKQWQEDIDLTLMDYKGRPSHFQITYHPWKGFSLQLLQTKVDNFLDQDEIFPKISYYLRTGMSLRCGERNFRILISMIPHEKALRSEFESTRTQALE